MPTYNPYTDTHAIEKYQFLSHFLPHPVRKTRAKLLSNTAVLSYSIILIVLISLFHIVPKVLPGTLGYASNIKVEDLFKLTNDIRAERNLSALRLNPVLTKAARLKADHMFNNDYWAHVAPDGTEPWDFILDAGYDYAFAGENLAKNFGLSSEVVEAWYRSPSHKDNLLSSNYDEVGFAVVNGVLDGYETTLVVQMFGRPRSPAYLASAEEEKKLLEAVSIAAPETVVPVIAIEPASEVLPAIDVGTASKTITFVVSGFLFLLLAMDIWYTRRKAIPKLTGHAYAHLSFLIITAIGVWLALSPGRIL